MADQPAFGLPTRPAAHGLLPALALLGWDGLLLPELTLLGCPVVPVVLLDEAVHAARQVGGHGPQRDRAVLEIWEWPQMAGHAPATALSVRGMLIRAGTWRRGLAVARTWRGFGPAAVLTGPAAVDDTCRLEFQLPGVGLVVTGAAGEPALAVAPAAGRQRPARRRVLDRWVEETLYQHALRRGGSPLTSPSAPVVAASASTADAVVPTSSRPHR
jgi:hypothetical protein